jgi:uncharacterized protein
MGLASAPMGNPFCHLDLATDDVAAAKKFYGSIFDWKFKDMPQMNWTGIAVGKGVGGGMAGKNMPEQPTAWTAYVEVKNVKETIAKAEKAGAHIVVPFMEIPGTGTIGVFVDPQGAALGVYAPMKKASAPKRKAAPKKAAKKPAAKKAAKSLTAKKPAAKKGKKG